MCTLFDAFALHFTTKYIQSELSDTQGKMGVGIYCEFIMVNELIIYLLNYNAF